MTSGQLASWNSGLGFDGEVGAELVVGGTMLGGIAVGFSG
jgi:hypothetical protein